MTVRALFRAAEVADAEPPYDRLNLKIYYPARPEGSDEERNSGVIPCDPSHGPLPVVVIMPGINVGPESYGWLARSLADRGWIVVTYQMIAEEMPGYVSLTPGLRLSALGPDGFGAGPSTTALGAILDALTGLNGQSGPLQGMIDPERVVIGGHSAGGTVALLNGNRNWFPAVRGVFSYAAHTAAATALGHAAGVYLEAWPDCPVLLMGGTRDGVIAASGGRYEDARDDGTARIVETFEQAVPACNGRSRLVLLEGANHFTLADPVDPATGRGFLDGEEVFAGSAYRGLLADLVAEFAADCCDRPARPFDEILADAPQLVAVHQNK